MITEYTKCPLKIPSANKMYQMAIAKFSSSRPSQNISKFGFLV
jgi:hypothetical protein